MQLTFTHDEMAALLVNDFGALLMLLAGSGVLDPRKAADAIETAATAMPSQLEADVYATLAQRLRMAAKPSLGVIEGGLS